MIHLRTLLFLIALLSAPLAGHAQAVVITHEARDRAYIKDFYKTHLIARVYESSRFNDIKISDGNERLVYKPNHHNDIGLGFTYKVISFNFEFFIPFLAQNANHYGATHSFDIQTYVYYHRFVIDLYSQFYNGYYLANGSQALAPGGPAVLKRPDITSKDISLVFQYVFNDAHFSFNAPFMQNEIQEKSAGSFLLGGGIYHNDGHADSSFVPSVPKYESPLSALRFTSFSYTGIGANGGYAYTHTIRKHFFITGSVSAGVGVGDAVVNTGTFQSRVGMQYMVNGKFAAGYTNDKYFIGLTYVRLVTEINSVAPHAWEQESTGNFRFTVARRFRVKKDIIPKTNIIKIE